MSHAPLDPLSLPDSDFLTKARAMCRCKAAFVTRAEAVALTRRGQFKGTPYLCHWCQQWHLTTYNRARAKQFTRRLSRLLRAENSELAA